MLLFSIYRKLIQTDIIISNNYCQPYENKFSSNDYILNRAHNYLITKAAYEIAFNAIRGVLLTNKQHQLNQYTPPPTKAKCTRWFTTTKNKMRPIYVQLKRSKGITKLFRDTLIKRSFRTQNIIQQILQPNSQTDK